MRKSVTSLICGLIGSLICLTWGFIGAVAGNIIIGTSNGEVGAVFSILAWGGFFGAIIGIVGSSMSLRNAKPAGAICLGIATLMCGAFHIYCFVKVASAGAVWATVIVFTFLPIVLLIVATVMAMLTKEVKMNGPSQMAYGQQPQQNFAPQQPFVSQPMGPQTQQPEEKKEEKSLEEEITKLKEMVEKGLLTEEEFAEAKKGLLAKYSK